MALCILRLWFVHDFYIFLMTCFFFWFIHKIVCCLTDCSTRFCEVCLIDPLSLVFLYIFNIIFYSILFHLFNNKYLLWILSLYQVLTYIYQFQFSTSYHILSSPHFFHMGLTSILLKYILSAISPVVSLSLFVSLKMSLSPPYSGIYI